MHTCVRGILSLTHTCTHKHTHTNAHANMNTKTHTKENIEQPRAVEREVQEINQIAATRISLDPIEKIQQHQQQHQQQEEEELTLAGLMRISLHIAI